MRTKTPFSLLVGAAFFAITGLSAADAQTGLWHLLDDKYGNTVCFMVNTGADSWRVYSGDWGPLKAPDFADGGAFRTILPFGKRSSVKVHVEGAFQGERLGGSWQIKHLQFQESGTWQGRRISPDPEWKPWGAILRNRNKVVNLTEQLSARVPFSDLSDFKKSWQKEIEKDYYAVLTPTLFSGPSGRFSKKFRDEQLGLIYRSLGRDSGAIDSARTLETTTRAVHEDLKRLYSWYKLDASIVVLPTGGQFDFRYFRLAAPQRSFFLISTDWLSTSKEAEMKNFLAQGLLYAAVREGRPFPTTTSSEIAVRGIAARLSVKGEYLSSPYDLLFIKEGDEEGLAVGFNSFRRTLLKDSASPIAVSFPKFLKGETRSDSYYFGYQFAHRLLETFSVKEILDINIPEKFLPQLNDFISDEAVKPVPLSEIGS